MSSFIESINPRGGHPRNFARLVLRHLLAAFRARRQAGVVSASSCGIRILIVVAVAMGGASARAATDQAADANPPSSGMTPPATASQPNPVAILAGSSEMLADKLKKIHLRNVSYDGLPLSQVLNELSVQCRLVDPEHRGVNFVILNKLDPLGQPADVPSAEGTADRVSGYGTVSAPGVDPVTGLPMNPKASAGAEPTEALDVGASLIKLPLQAEVRLVDVLDALVLVADRPIQYSVRGYAVVFSAKTTGNPQLFMRTFKVDAASLRIAIDNERARTGLVSGTSGAHSAVGAAARDFFQQKGVDWNSPPGKSVFFNDRLGVLFVKATEEDLDTIERAVEALNPAPSQVHLQARFVEVTPSAEELGFDWYLGQFSLSGTGESALAPSIGILPGPNFQFIWQTLQSSPGVKTLGEPGINTLSGRQTQMRATLPHPYIIDLKARVPQNYIGDFPPYHNGDPIHEGVERFNPTP